MVCRSLRTSEQFKHCSKCMFSVDLSSSFFFFNDTATIEIYTLSLHDALPIFTQPPTIHHRRPAPRTTDGGIPPGGRLTSARNDLYRLRFEGSRPTSSPADLFDQAWPGSPEGGALLMIGDVRRHRTATPASGRFLPTIRTLVSH